MIFISMTFVIGGILMLTKFCNRSYAATITNEWASTEKGLTVWILPSMVNPSWKHRKSKSCKIPFVSGVLNAPCNNREFLFPYSLLFSWTATQ